MEYVVVVVVIVELGLDKIANRVRIRVTSGVPL